MVRIVPSDRKNGLPTEGAIPLHGVLLKCAEQPDRWKTDLHAEQIRLLYGNAGVAVGVTILVSGALAYLQWYTVLHWVVETWLAYMILEAFGVWLLARRFERAAAPAGIGRWGQAFILGSALSAAGWGAAGILLFPQADLAHQVILAFVIGGMMLGSGSILSSRPVAFLSFPILAGVPLALRFLLHGGAIHDAMGLLILLFTAAILITDGHLYQTVALSLVLRFENRDLVEDLQRARRRLEILNEDLEHRVHQRTAELDQAVAHLQREIAERQRAEEERARAEADLRQAQKLEAVGILAAGIAHDFNNLLTSIAGYATLLRQALPRDATSDDYLDEILTASSRAGSLVKRLLVFGRRAEHRPELLPIVEVVGTALKIVQNSLPPRITLRPTLDPNCGCIFADSDLIHQIVMNLCANAREAVAAKGGRIEVSLDPVEVSAENRLAGLPDGPYVRLTVRDTGPGIPAAIAERIFEPFFTTKSPGKGSGLGLSVVHGIVNTYGGCVTAETHSDGGAIFRVFLPRRAAVQKTAPESPEASAIPTLRILFVDDDEAIARLGALLLRRLGHDVTSTASSAKALRIFAKDPDAFDLVITDLTMPQLNGIQLIARLKQIRADLPVVLASGFNDPSIGGDQAWRIGVHFLSKPFSVSSLVNALRQALEKDDPRGKN